MQNQDILILAIESSCDDTSAAVLKGRKVLSNIVASQKVHQRYGGVVPELASRAHQQHIVPVVDEALKKAGVQRKELSAIAFTVGPGLMGSLLVGASFAKSMAMGLGIPLIEVHHMQAHILAHFIDDNEKTPTFPFIAMTVSGGHTQIVRVNDYFSFEIIGQTQDDAVGEAFDKTAKLLGLPYPGGPLIDKYAQDGDAKAFTFPKPKMKGYDFSFSGLKTSIMYFIQRSTEQNPMFVQEHLNDICASIQHTIVSILMEKLKKAVDETGIKKVAIGGGVSANSAMRKALRVAEENGWWQSYLPRFEYCTDNAAMVGIVAYYKYLNSDFAALNSTVKARLPF